MARNRKLKRYGAALVVGGLAALSLLWVMQFLIATGEAALTEDRSAGFVDFVRVIPEEPPPPPKQPEQPPEVENPPPQVRQRESETSPGPTITIGQGPTVEIPKNEPGTNLFGFDGDLVPLVQPNPIYPQTALRKGLEGYCDLEFTVTELGTTTDVRATYCTSSVFERASIRAMLKAKYKPRVIDGVPLAVSGKHVRLAFEIED